MKVTLLDYTNDAEQKIGEAAGICYNADSSPDSCRKRAKKAAENGHLAVLRFAYATFQVSEISRVCSHQLVRMAHAGILQESQRYVKQTAIKYVDPPMLATVPLELQEEWHAIQARATALYGELVGEYLKKEDARYILPQGCTTKVNLCLNFQAWQHFLYWRDDKAAQWEIREIAQAIRAQLHTIAPNLF